MGHTETKTYTPLQGEIMDWVSVNSWVNIIYWPNWFVGTCEDAEAAEKWFAENGVNTRYFKAFEAPTLDEAVDTVELYVENGSETTAEGEGPKPGPMVYVFKTFI